MIAVDGGLYGVVDRDDPITTFPSSSWRNGRQRSF